MTREEIERAQRELGWGWRPSSEAPASRTASTMPVLAAVAPLRQPARVHRGGR